MSSPAKNPLLSVVVVVERTQHFVYRVDEAGGEDFEEARFGLGWNGMRE